MLNIKTVVKYKKTLNIKRWCEASGLNYATFNHKIHRHLKNSQNGELKVTEAEKLIEGLKKLKIKLLS